MGERRLPDAPWALTARRAGRGGSILPTFKCLAFRGGQNTGDIHRGIFQCVKYQAVLRAMLKAQGKVPTANAVLVLENALPEELRETVNRLGVYVFDGIFPKAN